MTFKMTINLGNVQPSKSVKKDLVTGVYKCKITKMEGKQPIVVDGKIDGYKRGMWVFQVVEDGDYNGCTTIHSMNTPKDGNDWIARLWLDSLLSCGYDMDEIVDMPEYDESIYVNRECYIQFTAPSDNGGQYSKVRFLPSEDDYITLKERGVSTEAKKAKATAKSTPTNSSPKIDVKAPPTGDLNSLIDGIGDVGF